MISARDFWLAAKNELAKGTDMMLCLVVEKQGSAPRGPGAHMLVMQSGSSLGTIGGGALEYEVKQAAQRDLQTGTSSLKQFALNNDDAAKEGMICGGQLRVLLLHLSAKDAAQTDKAAKFADERKSFVLCIDWHGSEFSFQIYSPDEDFSLKQELTGRHKKSLIIEDETQSNYREICRQQPMLYLFGGGWVAQELAKLLPMLEFDYVVLEERPEFASRKLFPHASDIVVTDFDDFTSDVNIQPSDFAVVVTSGHRKDTAVLEQLLKIAPSYIGAIGSRRKKAIINQYLKEHDFTDKQIKRIHLPIGLDIHAQTPAEIAVSIAAQLIEQRNTL